MTPLFNWVMIWISIRDIELGFGVFENEEMTLSIDLRFCINLQGTIYFNGSRSTLEEEMMQCEPAGAVVVTGGQQRTVINNYVWTAPEQGTFKCNVMPLFSRIEIVMGWICAFKMIMKILVEHKPSGGKVAFYLMKPKLGA
ncbi:hypothetical protein L195_g030285 [Trifolium pratense]|uniref:Uncharacterized protein n=1 Tax=Trifolium pratense TaxID=57577 RepID=A0A2K3L757_TRIPR|nr:hypothetical protein L195_g030285 [Trifolium pratense]